MEAVEITYIFCSVAIASIEKPVLLRSFYSILFRLTNRIKYVKTSFIFSYIGDSWLLEKIAFNAGTFDGMVRAEIYLCVFSKSTRIFISYSFAITKCFKDRITSQDLPLNRQLMSLVGTETSQHLHAVLGGFSFASPWLSRDDNGLFLNLVDHPLESSSCNCVDVRHFDGVAGKDGIFDGFNNLWAVEVDDLFVGIDGDKGGSNWGINFILLIPPYKVVEDAFLAELSHKTHIIMIFATCIHQFLLYKSYFFIK